MVWVWVWLGEQKQKQYVCMYVRMFLCMYVCRYVCTDVYKQGWADHLCVSVERLLLRHGPHQRHVLQQTHVRLCEKDGEVGDGSKAHFMAGCSSDKSAASSQYFET